MKPRPPARLSRRLFLRRAATAASLPTLIHSSSLGLNGATSPANRITFAAIGVGNRARSILPNFLAQPDIQFVAVSDARTKRLQSGKDLVDAHYRNQDCQVHPDFRDVLARQDIDAVFIATGNRWHGMASIHAARAGKDIYCEKPVTLTIAEGRELVDTCRRFGTVYQAGTQRRSTESYRFAVEMVRQGKLGRLHTVEMQVWAGPALPLGKVEPVPAGWNYDQWLGQAPWRPFTPVRVYNWQYYWDTAEGVLTDMGCHYTDQMQFALDTDAAGPLEFEARGEFPDPKLHGSDTPVTAEAHCTYADGVKGVMYQRGAFKDRYLRFIGDDGWIQVDDETDLVTAEPGSLLGLKRSSGVSWANAGAHIRNLVDSIRSRRPTLCNPEVAHRAITICQAWNLSLRLGRELRWDPVAERFDDETANRMLYREPRAPWGI